MRVTSNPRSRARQAKRFAAGLAFFVLGGTTAAAWSVVHQPDTARARPRPSMATTAASADRIAVSPGALRQAYAAGLVDRPVKSILNVPGRMQYGDYRWDDH